MNEKKNKIVYLEILRLIAIFGVVFCHTESDGVHHYVQTANPVNYWFGIFCATVVQCCIPLFFMITGAVLLNRQESLAYVYRHRVLRIAAVTVMISILQYLWNYRGHFDSMSLKGYLRLLYEGGISAPIWFLFAYLSMLFTLPFLQRMVSAIPEKSWFLYLFLAWLLLNDVLTIMEYWTGWGPSKLDLSGIQGYVMWAVMGYFVEHRSEDIFLCKKNILILTGASVLLTAVSMYINYTTLADSAYVTMGQLFVSVYALVIFVAVRYICYGKTMPRRLEQIICFAGAGVFGTYLIEIQLREFFRPVYVELAPRIHAFPASLVWVAVCVLAGTLLFNLIKRIPVVGKLF